MRAIDLLNRINGFSTPFGGVSWENKALAKDIAKKVIVFLEDRRVLYIESGFEIPRYCLESIREIRRFLTDMMGEFPNTGEKITNLEVYLAEMRSACSIFMTAYDRIDIDIDYRRVFYIDSKTDEDQDDCKNFVLALLNLRTVFAVNINRISKEYGVAVREERLKEVIGGYVKDS